jgi:hypothetical protein
LSGGSLGLRGVYTSAQFSGWLASCASPQGFSPEGKLVSYFFFFLAAFFFFIALFRFGLDLVARVRAFFLTGIDTSF